MNDNEIEIEPIESTSLDEALTTEEMSNLITALSEWDSYSLVG